MKKTIIALVFLFVCFSVFADSNTSWSYSSESDCLSHITGDFALFHGEEVKYGGTDFDSDKAALALTFYPKDTLAFFFIGIVENKEVDFVAYADSFDDYLNGAGVTFEPKFSTVCSSSLDEKSSEFVYNQLAYYNPNGQACFCISFTDGDFILFNVNCSNFYRYTSLIKSTY